MSAQRGIASDDRRASRLTRNGPPRRKKPSGRRRRAKRERHPLNREAQILPATHREDRLALEAKNVTIDVMLLYTARAAKHYIRDPSDLLYVPPSSQQTRALRRLFAPLHYHPRQWLVRSRALHGWTCVATNSRTSLNSP
jgi:hypothetical protein